MIGYLEKFFQDFRAWDPCRITLELSKDQNVIMIVFYLDLGKIWTQQQIACRKSFSEIDTATNNLLSSFGSPVLTTLVRTDEVTDLYCIPSTVLHTLHSTAHSLYMMIKGDFTHLLWLF